MKRILVLEDSEERIKWFQATFGAKHTLDITADPDEAVRCLRKHQYELVFLDHDLDETHYGNYTAAHPGTGQEVARFLCDHPEIHQDRIIVVHSVNPLGSARMCDIMRLDGQRERVLQIPYLTLKQANIIWGDDE